MRVLEVQNRRAFAPEQFLCEEHANLVWNSYLIAERIGIGLDPKVENAAAFELELMMADQRKDLHKLMLREVDNRRLLFLPIGYLEICVLHFALQQSPYNQWTLHVAMARLIEYFGAELAYIIIDGFHPDGYFIAKAVVRHGEKQLRVQIRPSDGLALAILTEKPFLVSEGVLTNVGKNKGSG